MTRSHLQCKSEATNAEVSFVDKDGELAIFIGVPGNQIKWYGNKTWAAQWIADLAAFWGIRVVVEGEDGKAVEPRKF